MQGLGLLVILFFFGLAGGIVGRIKGSSFFIWFLVVVLRSVHRTADRVFYRYDTRSCAASARAAEGRQAPRRGLHDCGTELEFPDVAIASEASMRRRAA